MLIAARGTRKKKTARQAGGNGWEGDDWLWQSRAIRAARIAGAARRRCRM